MLTVVVVVVVVGLIVLVEGLGNMSKLPFNENSVEYESGGVVPGIASRSIRDK